MQVAFFPSTLIDLGQCPKDGCRERICLLACQLSPGTFTNPACGHVFEIKAKLPEGPKPKGDRP